MLRCAYCGKEAAFVSNGFSYCEEHFKESVTKDKKWEELHESFR
jgi:hypothetical protein